MRGRTPDGPEAVQRLDGSALAKRRLGLLLQVLGGHCRVQQAWLVNASRRDPRTWHKPTSIQTCGGLPGRLCHTRSRNTS